MTHVKSLEQAARVIRAELAKEGFELSMEGAAVMVAAMRTLSDVVPVGYIAVGYIGEEEYGVSYFIGDDGGFNFGTVMFSDDEELL